MKIQQEILHKFLQAAKATTSVLQDSLVTAEKALTAGFGKSNDVDKEYDLRASQIREKFMSSGVIKAVDVESIGSESINERDSFDGEEALHGQTAQNFLPLPSANQLVGEKKKRPLSSVEPGSNNGSVDPRKKRSTTRPQFSGGIS